MSTRAASEMPEGPAKPASKWSRLYRRRLRTRRLTMAVAMTALAIFAVTGFFLLLATRPQTLTVAAGPRDGVDAKILQAIARRFSEDNAKIKLRLVFTDNQPAGYDLVTSGGADAAVVRADTLADDALALAVLRRSAVLLFSGTRDKPEHLKAVKGTRVGVAGGGTDDMALVQLALAASGHSFELGAFDPERPAPGFALTALVAPARSKAARDLAATMGQPHLVPVETAEAIVREHPHLESVELPPGILSVNPVLPAESVQTIGVAHLLVASKDLSEQKASAFVKALFAHRNAVLRETGGEAVLEKPATEKDAAIRPHPGVAKYIDGTEQTFFERYSDLFWGAVLVLSGLGSAGAWFRALYYRGEVDTTATRRDQLLDLVAKLRDEATPADIAGMERKADTLLRETLDRYERGAVDDATLTTFGLALEHFRDVARSARADAASRRE